MKITVEFANLDEFKQYMGIESPSQLALATNEAADAPAPAPAETVQEPQEAPEAPAPKKNTKKADKPAPAAAAGDHICDACCSHDGSPTALVLESYIPADDYFICAGRSWTPQ